MGLLLREPGATTIGMIAAVVALGANTASALLGRSINRTATMNPLRSLR